MLRNMNIITADDLRLMYQGMSKEYRNNNVLNDIVKWLKPYAFTKIATFRPKKTKINSVNAYKLFIQALWKIPTLKHLFYSIEQDRYGKSNHAHLLLAGDISKTQFADAINRNASAELPYFESINNLDASIVYTNKRQRKSDLIKGYGIVSQNDVDKEIDLQCGITPHPNKVYHERAEIYASRVYGWKKYHKGRY